MRKQDGECEGKQKMIFVEVFSFSFCKLKRGAREFLKINKSFEWIFSINLNGSTKIWALLIYVNNNLTRQPLAICKFLCSAMSTSFRGFCVCLCFFFENCANTRTFMWWWQMAKTCFPFNCDISLYQQVQRKFRFLITDHFSILKGLFLYLNWSIRK